MASSLLNLEAEMQKKRPDVDYIKSLLYEIIEAVGEIDKGMRGKVWRILLGVNHSSTYGLETLINETHLDLENQRTILVDSERTCFKSEEEKSILRKLLTFYCKRRGVRYKQGLHEILG